MKKNGRTLLEDIKHIIRGIKEFDKILPGQMWLAGVSGILKSCIPYIAVIMSALIINELTQGRDIKKLLFYVLISVGMTFMLYILKSYLDSKISVGYSMLFSAHEIHLTDKSYELPYEMLESREVRELREKISGSINVSGAGMASLYWDTEVVTTNLCSAVIAVFLCADFFKNIILQNGISIHGVINSVSTFLGLFLLIVICSFISCKMTGKRFDVAFEVFQNGAKYIRYGEFYTMNYLSDENHAPDIRIFRQKKLILEESQAKCYEHFADGKEKEMHAVNKYDGTKLLCTGLCGMAVYVIVGQKALDGVIGTGNVLMVYSAVTMLILSLSELSQIITDLRNNNEHLINYFTYMDLSQHDYVKESEIKKEESGLLGKFNEIRFENVSFRYPGSENWTLRDVNLVIYEGEKVAIIGENGSGKSTLIKLLCRLYKPTEGRILLNGQNIWEYPYQEYIKLISTVFQDYSLFAFSLGENIAAMREFDEERVKQAIYQANLGQKFESLPKGLSQNLFHDFEEDGMDLSGGEAQKVGIARAIYKNAPIMILDEPTAALDPYAEYEIYKNFHEITGEKTVISISHRLSSCRICDKVAVFERGRLIQYGSHEELLEDKTSKYYEMWQAQARYYT